MAEFMKALKTDKITFASAGTGTPGYFAGEFLKAKTHGNLDSTFLIKGALLPLE